MERKQGFFAALKEEMARGLSPSRSRRGRSQSSSPSGLMRLRRGCSVAPPEMYVSRSSSVRPGAEALSPLREGPDSGDPRADSWANWLCRAPTLSNSGSGCSKSDLRLLLGVLGAPLAPVRVSNNEPLPHLCIKDTPIESSSAQYILQQYLAASGGQKVRNCIRNECLRNGEGEDAGIRYRDHRKQGDQDSEFLQSSGVWGFCPLANESRYVVCRARSWWQQDSCWLQRQARLAAYSVAWCTFSQRACPASSPCPTGL